MAATIIGSKTKRFRLSPGATGLVFLTNMLTVAALQLPLRSSSRAGGAWSRSRS